MNAPFIIYALPRSRTAWLAEFLTYKDWTCYHEQALCMRDMNDVKALLSLPKAGTVETAAAQGRPLIRHLSPSIKEIVILRAVDEVVESMMSVDVSGVATYDCKLLKRNMEYGDRVLRKIATDNNVLTIQYNDLNKLDVCAQIFEHCLPYRMPKSHWNLLINQNIQVDVKSVLRYYHNNYKTVESFKKMCKSELRRLCRLGEIGMKASA